MFSSMSCSVPGRAFRGTVPVRRIKLVAFSLLGAGVIVASAVRGPQRATVETKPPTTLIRCHPHDAALGNAGGDPYAFYVFNREESLVRVSAEGCGSPPAPTFGGRR